MSDAGFIFELILLARYDRRIQSGLYVRLQGVLCQYA